MARYLVTSDSHFTPFTYDEMVKPLAQMTEAHNAAQEKFDALNFETEALRNYIDKDNDPLVQQRYDAYLEKLNRLQSNLRENGIGSGTSRDLTEARAAYVSDITKIAKAIKDRQDRSATFWEAKHKNPDLIMGEDPGLSSLDEFFSNDKFGQDFYSYSGNALTKEVGTDAQTRMKEVFRQPTYRKNPDLPGYYIKREFTGATSEEVDKATNAARSVLFGGVSKDDATKKLSEPERILTEVLLSHMESAGLTGKVTPEEYQRAFDYATAGLSQAIGTERTTDIQDREFASPKSGSGNPVKNTAGYTFFPDIRSRKSPEFDEVSKIVSKKREGYGNSGINLVIPGSKGGDANEMHNVQSPFTMGNFVYNTPYRSEARTLFGGLDIALSASKEQVGTIYVGGRPVTVMTKKVSGSEAEELGGDVAIVGKRNGKEEILRNESIAYNKARALHDAYVQRIANENSFDIRNVAITPDEQYDLYRKFGFDPLMDPSDLEAAVTAKARVEDYTQSTLLQAHKAFDPDREVFGELMINSFSEDAGESSRRVAYRVDKESGARSESGTGKESDIFNTDSNGKALASSLRTIYFDPYEVAKAWSPYGADSIMFNFTTDKDNDQIWEADIVNLGPEIVNRFKNSAATYIMHEALLPMMEPDKCLLMSTKDAVAWADNIYKYLNANPNGEIITPIVKEGDRYRPATPAEIVRDKVAQQQLYNAARQWLDMLLSGSRQLVHEDQQQHRSFTAKDPSEYYNGQYIEE